MTILHYIPSLQKSMGQTAQFAQMLKDVMGKTIETYIISGSVSRTEFVTRLSEVHPDIVHLHGCWSLRIAMAERWAMSRGYPVILSPHDGMSPRVLQTDFWKKRMPQIVAYQFRTIKNAFVLHAASAQELKDLKELGWKKRIALIPYPKSPSDNQMLCDSFHALYQKVIDTQRRNQLNTHEREALWVMLNAAISAEHTPYEPTDAEKQHLSQLTSHNWQTIQVYAIDHRITDLMLKGASALSINIPVVVKELPPRYSQKPCFHSGTEKAKEKNTLQKYSSHHTEKELAADIFVLYRSLYHNELREGYASPLTLLCSIGEKLRWGKCDEDIVTRIINELGISRFTACLMQVLSETLHITLGFMLLDPINDEQTENIRKRLNNLI